MSISKAFGDLSGAEQFVFANALLNPQVAGAITKVISWSKDQLATLDPDSSDFESSYRELRLTISILNEMLNLSKQEKNHVTSIQSQSVDSHDENG